MARIKVTNKNSHMRSTEVEFHVICLRRVSISRRCPGDVNSDHKVVLHRIKRNLRIMAHGIHCNYHRDPANTYDLEILLMNLELNKIVKHFNLNI